jgi:hypothetical protein
LFTELICGTAARRWWVDQDQILSPRVLYYNKDGISWHCISSKENEAEPNMASVAEEISSPQKKFLHPITIAALQTTGLASDDAKKVDTIIKSDIAVGMDFYQLMIKSCGQRHPDQVRMAAYC